MKYILKKDLLFMKIGEIIGVNVNGWIGVHLQRLTDGGKYIDCNKEDFDLLLSEGWIEEVKPREWILEITPEQEYIRARNENGEINGRLFSSGSELIKVREVII